MAVQDNKNQATAFLQQTQDEEKKRFFDKNIIQFIQNNATSVLRPNFGRAFQISKNLIYNVNNPKEFVEALQTAGLVYNNWWSILNCFKVVHENQNGSMFYMTMLDFIEKWLTVNEYEAMVQATVQNPELYTTREKALLQLVKKVYLSSSPNFCPSIDTFERTEKTMRLREKRDDFNKLVQSIEHTIVGNSQCSLGIEFDVPLSACCSSARGDFMSQLLEENRLGCNWQSIFKLYSWGYENQRESTLFQMAFDFISKWLTPEEFDALWNEKKNVCTSKEKERFLHIEYLLNR